MRRRQRRGYNRAAEQRAAFFLQARTGKSKDYRRKITIERGRNHENEGGTAEIARFDTLELAAIVLRYMNGDSLSEADAYRAKEAIKKADAPTDESKRDRKAD